MGSIVDDVVKVASLGTVNTDFSGKKAGQNALNAQGQATDAANARMDAALVDQKKEMEPWKAAGMSALAGMQDGSFFQKDPGYQFRLDEGNKAINNAASARGNAVSGSALKALTNYGQNFASNEFNNAYQRANNMTQMGFGASNNIANFMGGNAAAVGGNQINMGNATAANQIAGANRDSAMLNGAITAGAMAFSDCRLKTNVQSVDPVELAEMRKHLKAYAFNYISADFGKGDWVGVMAQDLEKSKLGRTLVFDDANGNKQIDLPKVLSMFLATMGAECQ